MAQAYYYFVVVMFLVVVVAFTAHDQDHSVNVGSTSLMHFQLFTVVILQNAHYNISPLHTSKI